MPHTINSSAKLLYQTAKTCQYLKKSLLFWRFSDFSYYSSLERKDTTKNAQYPPINAVEFDRSHDRFLCIDETVYHLGASIKDLGKKWFGFTLMENTDADEMIGRI